LLVFANLLNAVAVILNSLIWFVMLMVIARVIMSWVNADPYNPIVRFIISSTDPLLIPLQRKLPLRVGAIDFTPVVFLILLTFLQAFLVQTLADYSLKIRTHEIMGSSS